jgi:hypothetical protein
MGLLLGPAFLRHEAALGKIREDKGTEDKGTEDKGT